MKQLTYFLLFLFANLSFSSAQAQEPETRILLHAPQTTLEIGDEFSIEVQLDAAPRLYGYDVRVQFDPSVVEVIDMDDSQSGVQLGKGTFFAQPETTFLLLNEGDNETGAAGFAMVLVNPAPAVAGSGMLFTIPMRAIGNGEVGLVVTDSTLATKEIEHVPHVVESAEIQIGQFNTLWIGLIAGLLLLMLAAAALFYHQKQRNAVLLRRIPKHATQAFS
jgi:hypothetical protein